MTDTPSDDYDDVVDDDDDNDDTSRSTPREGMIASSFLV
jgi:hypothetical protein